MCKDCNLTKLLKQVAGILQQKDRGNKMKTTELKGSEKQKKWAFDIIEQVELVINVGIRNAHRNAEIEKRNIKPQVELKYWKKAKEDFSNYLDGLTEAKQVIDVRNTILDPSKVQHRVDVQIRNELKEAGYFDR